MDDVRTGPADAAPVRILVADDHELVRRGLISIIESRHPDWQIVGQASDGAKAIELGLKLKPGIAILDLAMPERNGLEVAQELLKHVPGIRVLILTMHAGAPILRQLKRAGIGAYIVKSDARRMLVDIMERLLGGEAFIASEGAEESPAVALPREYVPAQFLLTARELDVMRELVRGKSNKQVAADLQMSVRTVETHRANILAKLGANSLGDLVKIAMRDRVIEPN